MIEGADVLANPPRMLARLCTALKIPYSEAMLSWPSGRRETDGVWAPAWYESVERSTGFAAPSAPIAVTLPDQLMRIADQARPHYEVLAAYRLGGSGV